MLHGEPVQLAEFCTLVNAQRRVLADIGLGRKAREVVPLTEYIAQRSQESDGRYSFLCSLLARLVIKRSKNLRPKRIESFLVYFPTLKIGTGRRFALTSPHVRRRVPARCSKPDAAGRVFGLSQERERQLVDMASVAKKSYSVVPGLRNRRTPRPARRGHVGGWHGTEHPLTVNYELD